MSTITRKDDNNYIRCGERSGYRSIISNGENHFCIDTCYTYDCGNETMVFVCDENGKVTHWDYIDCRRNFGDSEMEQVHNEMVQKWINKLERGDK